jgi:hypothetical protein
MPSVYIATPATRAFEAEFVASLLYTEHDDFKMWWQPVRGRAIDDARNTLTKTCLEDYEHFDYLLMCDSDATWDKGAVARLVSRDLPMVSAIMYQRKIPPLPTLGHFHAIHPTSGKPIYRFTETVTRLQEYLAMQEVGLDTLNELVLPETDEDLYEIDGSGMHFTLIRRDVLEAIDPPWFKLTEWGAGEDFYFCRKVRSRGIKIHADLSVHTGHLIGPGNEVGVREFLAWMTYSDGKHYERDIDGNIILEVG